MKTQKSFRKKALLSSVAMLLVATVAVGSATFAWFTNSTSATANNLSLKASSSKGLQVSTDGTTWGTNQTWADLTDNTVSPLSVSYSNNAVLPTAIYAEKAGADGAWDSTKGATYDYTFASKDFANPSAYVNHDTHYLSYKVDVKVNGADKDTTAALSVSINKGKTSSDIDKIIRIAIVDSATNKVQGVYGATPVKALTSTTPTIADTVSPVTTASISLGNITNTTRTFYVYLWIEGQDTNCKDNMMDLAADYNIKFSVPEGSL